MNNLIKFLLLAVLLFSTQAFAGTVYGSVNIASVYQSPLQSIDISVFILLSGAALVVYIISFWLQR